MTCPDCGMILVCEDCSRLTSQLIKARSNLAALERNSMEAIRRMTAEIQRLKRTEDEQ